MKLVEMENHGPNARCCGAGGGVKSNYAQLADAIAQDRVQEAVDTGADMLVTMCPFCQGSFDQAVKAMNAPIEVAGVDTLLLEAMGGNDGIASSSGKA